MFSHAFVLCNRADKLQLRKPLTADSLGTLLSRRAAILCSGASLVSFFTLSCGLTPSLVKAEENSPNAQEEEGDNGVIGAIKSLFDPNEKTKSGKLLPKAYLKAAREVVKALRESLEEDTKDVAKFRRSADAAKDSIREYLNGWRGQQAVSTEVPKPRIAWRILLETKSTTRTRLTAEAISTRLHFCLSRDLLPRPNHMLRWREQSGHWLVSTRKQVPLQRSRRK